MGARDIYLTNGMNYQESILALFDVTNYTTNVLANCIALVASTRYFPFTICRTF